MKPTEAQRIERLAFILKYIYEINISDMTAAKILNSIDYVDSISGQNHIILKDAKEKLLPPF